MKIYETVQEWREKEKFVEMARIGNLPKHVAVSIWVNDRGEEREAPHFHVRSAKGEIARIKIIDLKPLDKRVLSSSLMKEFKLWAISPSDKNKKITNIEAIIFLWNSQEHNIYDIEVNDVLWIKEINGEISLR